MSTLKEVAAWFASLDLAMQVALVVTFGGLVGLLLWSFVFAGADYSGFGDWLLQLVGAG